MKRVLWATDIHLNFPSPERLDAFFRDVREAGSDALLVGGDIAEANTIESFLLLIRDQVEVPVYFVLGNHDFYRGSVADVRSRVAALARNDAGLHWLPEAGVVELSSSTALVGHDGFYDARLGDPWGSEVVLTDFWMIRELASLEKRERHEMLEQLGREAAEELGQALSAALERFEEVIVLTHVPPFREACWHEGQISDDEWLPFFTSKAMGDVLSDAATRNPERRIVVLCGHTHGAGEATILPNLDVYTGGAVYGSPAVHATLMVEPGRHTTLVRR